MDIDLSFLPWLGAGRYVGKKRLSVEQMFGPQAVISGLEICRAKRENTEFYRQRSGVTMTVSGLVVGERYEFWITVWTVGRGESEKMWAAVRWDQVKMLEARITQEPK